MSVIHSAQHVTSDDIPRIACGMVPLLVERSGALVCTIAPQSVVVVCMQSALVAFGVGDTTRDCTTDSIAIHSAQRILQHRAYQIVYHRSCAVWCPSSRGVAGPLFAQLPHAYVSHIPLSMSLRRRTSKRATSGGPPERGLPVSTSPGCSSDAMSWTGVAASRCELGDVVCGSEISSRSCVAAS